MTWYFYDPTFDGMSSDYPLWNNTDNWWDSSDGTGNHPAAVPWTTSLTEADDVQVSPSYNQSVCLDVNLGYALTITGSCNLHLPQVKAQIYGGTYTGAVRLGSFGSGYGETPGIIYGGTFSGTVEITAAYLSFINAGTFNGAVTNFGGNIYAGTFNGAVDNIEGTISGGTFGTVTNQGGGGATISGGAITTLTNYGQVGGVTVSGSYTNNGLIESGTFNGVSGTNYGTIAGGTFPGSGFTNHSTGIINNVNGTSFSGANFTNNGTINDGIFTGANLVNNGTIEGGSFSNAGLTNASGGIINGGLFSSATSVTLSSGAKTRGGTWHPRIIDQLYRNGFVGTSFNFGSYPRNALDVLGAGLA